MKYLLQEDEMEKFWCLRLPKKMADMVISALESIFQEEIGVIHSNKSQNYRFETIRRFADGSLKILIATDLVSRGLDISGLSHVINFDLPEQDENYMHRIGRTGRADQMGKAISLIKETEVDRQASIEKMMKFAIHLTLFQRVLKCPKC